MTVEGRHHQNSVSGDGAVATLTLFLLKGKTAGGGGGVQNRRQQVTGACVPGDSDNSGGESVVIYPADETGASVTTPTSSLTGASVDFCYWVGQEFVYQSHLQSAVGGVVPKGESSFDGD